MEVKRWEPGVSITDDPLMFEETFGDYVLYKDYQILEQALHLAISYCAPTLSEKLREEIAKDCIKAGGTKWVTSTIKQGESE